MMAGARWGRAAVAPLTPAPAIIMRDRHGRRINGNGGRAAAPELR
jgi:hypothetical protein